MARKAILGICFITSLLNCTSSKSDDIDLLFQRYQNKSPGAAFMVIHKGEVIDERYYGLADLEKSKPINRTTNFRLASVTKQFTAISILQLMENGKLEFSTGLREIFPEFPDYANQINFGQLLHHTSGIVSYESLIPDSATVPVSDHDVLQLLLQADSTYFMPGAGYRYSNSGYSLLALTVERLSGSSFPEYLQEYIFAPTEMRSSVAYVNGINTVPNRAYGYNVENGVVEFSDQSMTSSVLGDGGIYSSIADLFKWDQALYHHNLIGETWLDSAFSPWLEHYGCGFRIEDYKGYKRISHTGSTSGFRTVYQRFPESEFSVIVLTNRREPGVQYLAEALTDIYLLKNKD